MLRPIKWSTPNVHRLELVFFIFTYFYLLLFIFVKVDNLVVNSRVGWISFSQLTVYCRGLCSGARVLTGFKVFTFLAFELIRINGTWER